MVKPNPYLANILEGQKIITHDTTEYQESTLEKAQEFELKRNYHYTNTTNPIDFPPVERCPYDEWKPNRDIVEGFYDVGNLSLDEIKRNGRE